MRLKNILFVVEDIEKSKKFYQELFGLYVITDFGGNVIMSEGLVLQEKTIWKNFIGKDVVARGNDAELYFEENDMDGFILKLKNSSYNIEYVNEPMVHDWGQRVIRIYDLDGHIIEIGESMQNVVRRLHDEGMTIEQVANKTQLPVDNVETIINAIR